MFDFFTGQLWFLVTLIFVLWIPGRMGVLFLERKGRFLTRAERAGITVTLSVVMVDFLMIVLGQIGIPLTGISMGVGIMGVIGLLWVLSRGNRCIVETKNSASLRRGKMSWAFLVVFFLAMTIKVIYLVPNMVPASTDLGHHTFWIEKIVTEKKLPVYEEQEIEKDAHGKNSIGEAKPISDFIEGEHLMLSTVAMISGKAGVSAFAILALFVVHIATLFTMYALGRRLFEKFPWAESVGVWTLFFFGVLYSLGESQLRYVTGGAVGNTIGNLLIPVAFLLLILAVRLKRVDVFIASVLVMFGLVYTHHLSTLIFVLSLLGTVAFLGISNIKFFLQTIGSLVWNRLTLGTMLFLGSFFFFVYTPAYIRNMAVTQVVGAPENVEHLGFSFLQFSGAVGDPRIVLALVGFIFLILSVKLRRSDVTALLLGWTIPLTILVLFPDLVRINLPSARVANYVIFPLAILSGYALVMIFQSLQKYGGLSVRVSGTVILFVIVAVSYRGFFDNDLFLKTRANQTERALELFSASKYLSEEIPETVTVMHDHINIPGDAWVKLFFMRDYNYPFYRALLFRYDRATDKQEKCTLYVFSKPDSAEAKECQEDLNVRAVLVDEKLDGQQFQHFKNYWKVYNDPFHSVYVRNN